MNEEFPNAVPEIPVESVIDAAGYYENCLGFHRQRGVDGGFGQVCRGSCRVFLTDHALREGVRWHKYSGTSGNLIYYLRSKQGEIWLLTLYAKNVAESISGRTLKKIKEEIDG